METGVVYKARSAMMASHPRKLGERQGADPPQGLLEGIDLAATLI